jgi:hypothetical protein
MIEITSKHLESGETVPLSGVKISAPVVLAQQKGHERIGKAQKRIHRTSPIGPELAYKFRSTDRKFK